MEPVQYYITTLTAAFKNLAPVAVFLIGGYFIFIKMPFLFLRKSMSDQKKKIDEEQKALTKEEKYTVDDYKDFQRTLRLMNSTQEKKSEKKKTEQKKEPPRQRPPSNQERSPEDVFNLKPGQTFTQAELKKRYFELLKENHPDRVASMGADFKKLADKNTKDINKAFEVLKKKAS